VQFVCPTAPSFCWQLDAAAGAAAAVRGRPLPVDLALNGGLDLDGRVVPVHGVPATLRAAAAAGLRRVGVPAEGLDGLSPPAGLELLPLRTWAELDAALFPAPRPGRLPDPPSRPCGHQTACAGLG
jgi:predicted ATP-dependent serine protease